MTADRITAHPSCRFPDGALRLTDHNFRHAMLHPTEANTRLESLNVTATENSTMAITRLMRRKSLVLGGEDSSSRALNSMAAPARQTALVGRSVLVPTILPVAAQIAAGINKRVKNQSMRRVSLPRKMRTAAGTMEAKSAAIRKPEKRWCAKSLHGPCPNAAIQSI